MVLTEEGCSLLLCLQSALLSRKVTFWATAQSLRRDVCDRRGAHAALQNTWQWRRWGHSHGELRLGKPCPSFAMPGAKSQIREENSSNRNTKLHTAPQSSVSPTQTGGGSSAAVSTLATGKPGLEELPDLQKVTRPLSVRVDPQQAQTHLMPALQHAACSVSSQTRDSSAL